MADSDDPKPLGETPWDDKDPERVIGGYKAQVTQITSRLNAAKAFLISLGINPDDINEDGELIQGSPSDLADTRRKAELADAIAEAYRWKNISQKLRRNLQSLWGDMVSIDSDGNVWWNGLMGLIAELQLKHPEALDDLETYLKDDLEEGSRQPVGILEWFRPRSQDEASSRPVTPRKKADEPTGESFTKRTFGFDFGRKSRSDKES